VTVTGPGGVGKTRVADEVLRQVAGRFADGVWVAELAAVNEPALVPAMVAARKTGGQLAAARARLRESAELAVYCGGYPLRMIDILEQYGYLCAATGRAADVRILATSREPLGLPEALPAAPRPRPLKPEAGSRVFGPGGGRDAVLGRPVSSTQPHAGRRAAAAVPRLVQRLDGIPRHRLAAARVEALGLGPMLDRLDDGFRLLVSANRAAPARQRSLDAAVDWSYQLLPLPEQRVFRYLSVFPGPFSLDAAEAVAGTDAGPAVLHLVDCSLLVPPAVGPDGRSRYWMLETLRAYGPHQLRQAGEEPAAAAALAAHALSTADRAVAQLARGDRSCPRRVAGRRGRDRASGAGLGAGPRPAERAQARPGAGAVVAGTRPLGAGIRPAAARRRAGGPGRQCLVRRSGLAGSAGPRSVDFISVVLGHNSAVVTALKDVRRRPSRRRPGQPGAAQLGPAGRGGGRSRHRARPVASDRQRRGGGARPDTSQRYLDVRRPGRQGRGMGRAGAADTR
jgi:predicted ATPase